MRIVWTAAALRDLAAIREFFAADNPRAADRQVQLILAGVATLLQFPQVGRPGRVSGTNELVIGRHRIWSPNGFAAKRSRSLGFCTPGSAGPIACEPAGGRADNPLEFAPLRCYICGMVTRRGWMLRITGPILG